MRLISKPILGKYGYVDPDGILREASYGAEAGRGFEPQIAGLELPPPVVTQVEAEAVNEIVQQPQPQFQSFKPRRIKNREGEIKMINGRKALVKKVRKLKATPAPRRFIDESAQRQAGLTARQEGLSAFYRGFKASCLRLVSWNIVLWISYEQLKLATRNFYNQTK